MNHQPLQRFLKNKYAANDNKPIPQSQSLDELGSLTSKLASMLDERNQNRVTLNMERNFIDAVVNNAGALIVVLDYQGRITRFNRACEELSGYRFKEVEGKLVWDILLVPEEAEKVRTEAFLMLAKNPKAEKGFYTNKWVCKNGSLRTIEWNNTLLLDEQGNMEFMVSIGIDATERLEALEKLKRNEEALKEFNESLETRVAERTKALETSNRELEAFSYSIAHDLRAPLRSISSFSQIVLDDAQELLKEEDLQHLNRVINACKHMSQLIDDILSLSRLTRLQITREKLDLSEIASKIIQQFQHSDMDNNSMVKVTIEPEMHGYGDRQLIHLLLTNLLSNAWKYSRAQANPEIKFTLQQRDNKSVYVVQDNGVGFNMEEAKNLFRPFHRLHTQEEFSGTGVGLATAQRIVERHGGKIWVEAERGKGATFFFTLSV